MGYSHYWRKDVAIPRRQFHAIVSDFKKILPTLRSRGVRLRLDFDNSSPIELDDERVQFNGVGENGHETFIFERVYVTHDPYERNRRGKKSGFVKTAQKPYDLAVTSFLIIAKHHLGSSIIVSGDGTDPDWAEAKELVQSKLHYGEKCHINPKRVLLCPGCR